MLGKSTAGKSYEELPVLKTETGLLVSANYAKCPFPDNLRVKALFAEVAEILVHLESLRFLALSLSLTPSQLLHKESEHV